MPAIASLTIAAPNNSFPLFSSTALIKCLVLAAVAVIAASRLLRFQSALTVFSSFRAINCFVRSSRKSILLGLKLPFINFELYCLLARAGWCYFRTYSVNLVRLVGTFQVLVQPALSLCYFLNISILTPRFLSSS